MAAKSTQLLREDDDPLWTWLRELLRVRGLDPDQIALADFFPDDTDREVGTVVTPEGCVYELEMVYGKGDLRTAQAVFHLLVRGITPIRACEGDGIHQPGCP